jgi:hypothetical protein
MANIRHRQRGAEVAARQVQFRQHRQQVAIAESEC